jgi:hypothetical protein
MCFCKNPFSTLLCDHLACSNSCNGGVDTLRYAIHVRHVRPRGCSHNDGVVSQTDSIELGDTSREVTVELVDDDHFLRHSCSPTTLMRSTVDLVVAAARARAQHGGFMDASGLPTGCNVGARPVAGVAAS